MFNDLLWEFFARRKVEGFIIIVDFPSVVSFLIELCMPLRSVSLIWESLFMALGLIPKH